MSIPHQKRSGIAQFIQNHGPDSIRRIPVRPAPAPSPTGEAPSSPAVPSPGPVGAKAGSPGGPVVAALAAALAASLLLGVVLINIPTVQAEVIPSFNGTNSQITQVQTLNGGASVFYVNPANGKLLLIYKTAGNVCNMALSTDSGATWLRDKTTGLSTTGTCFADWIDDNSFIVSNGPAVIRTDNDGLTFTTLTAPPAITILFDVHVGGDQIFAIYGLIGTQGHFAYTYDGGTTWGDAAPASFSNSHVLTGIDYQGTVGSWTAGYRQSTVTGITYFASTVDDFTTNPTTGNGQLSVAWDPSTEGIGQFFVSCDNDSSNWYGTFTAANSAFATSLDLGLERGGGPLPIYQNANEGRTISQVVSECLHNTPYFTFKQTGDTITPRYVIGFFNNGAVDYRQLEDLDASTTAIIQGYGEYNGQIYIAYISGSGADARTHLLVGNDFGAGGDRITIPVDILIQADWDVTGTVIIAREEAGELVRTFNGGTGVETGSVATPDCGILTMGGVSAIQSENGNDFFTSYGSCNSSGESHKLWVAGASVDAAPPFPDGCTPEFCKEENEEFGVATNPGAQFNIPSNLRDLGTISFFPYSFEGSELDQTFENGYATWTFSTANGEVGAISVAYNDFAGDNGHREFLMVSPGNPLNKFCSWATLQGDTVRDYIGASQFDSPTVFAAVTANRVNVVQGSNNVQLQVDISGLFTNSAPYGFAHSMSCAGNRAIIMTDNEVYLINVTNAAGTQSDGSVQWSKTIANPQANDIVAISKDAKFVAWLNGTSQIEFAYASNGTVTGSIGKVSGQWVGMEFNGDGSRLRHETQDFIAIDTVSHLTCQDACGINFTESGQVRNLPPPSGGGQDTGGESEGITELLGNPYFWVLFWILLINVIIAALSWGTRAGFGGMVYGIATLIVYIFGILLNGPDEVSPWPIVAVLVFVIGLSISRWWNR